MVLALFLDQLTFDGCCDKYTGCLYFPEVLVPMDQHGTTGQRKDPCPQRDLNM